jgi:chitinase
MAFAKNVNLRRVSYWSANRDIACGAAVNDDRVSNTCSGVSQQPLDFAHIFAGGATRNRTALQTPAAGQTLGPNDVTVGGLARDDPRTSPYPIWRSPAVYEANAKVVWQGRVYEAKWWTQGNQPDAPVKHEWDTPWRYLGPVLESDREAVAGARSVIAGSQVPWAAEKVFVAGDEVKYDNKIFRAKWWTQGEPPQEYPDQPYDHPWEYLGDAPAPPK